MLVCSLSSLRFLFLFPVNKLAPDVQNITIHGRSLDPFVARTFDLRVVKQGGGWAPGYVPGLLNYEATVPWVVDYVDVRVIFGTPNKGNVDYQFGGNWQSLSTSPKLATGYNLNVGPNMLRVTSDLDGQYMLNSTLRQQSDTL
jgi:hypothetical protein